MEGMLLFWPSTARGDWDSTNSAPPSQRILVIYVEGGGCGGFGDNHIAVTGNLPDTFSGANGSGFNFNATYLAIPAGDLNGFSDNLTAVGLTLDPFDQVWDTRFTNCVTSPGAVDESTMQPSDMIALANYVAAGGSLYLQGENSGFNSRNESVVSFLNTYINDGASIPYPSVYVNSVAYPIDPVGGAQAENFHEDFWSIASVDTTYPGGFDYANGTGSGIPVTRIFNPGTARDETFAIAFDHAQIQPSRARGKVFANFEFNMLTAISTSTNNRNFVANVADFLTPDPLLRLRKSANPKTLRVGQNTTFTIVATNNSGTVLTNF